jgi:iron(III) transport system permease protein
VFCAVVGGLIFGLLAMSAWASLVTRWPYNLALTLNNYAFGEFDSNGWAAYWNSLKLAGWTAVIGTVVIFLGAYLLEKTRAFAFGRTLAQFMAMLPMAVPGWCWGWPTSSSSTPRATRSGSSTRRWRSWS